MLANIISSSAFGVRRLNKAGDQGDPVSAVIASGQFFNAGKCITALDNELGKTAKTAVDALKIAVKNEKIIEYAGKALNLAGKYINPLICISSGIKVITADDKQSALIQNGAALGSMFAAEHLMKNHMAEIPKMKCMQGLTKKFLEFEAKHKCKGKLSAVMQGAAFVVGSCTAYNLGDGFGKMVASKVKGEK